MLKVRVGSEDLTGKAITEDDITKAVQDTFSTQVSDPNIAQAIREIIEKNLPHTIYSMLVSLTN